MIEYFVWGIKIIHTSKGDIRILDTKISRHKNVVDADNEITNINFSNIFDEYDDFAIVSEFVYED